MGYNGGKGYEDNRGQGGHVNTIQFTQGYNTGVVPGLDGMMVNHITYFKYNKLVHCADFCPKDLESGKQHHMNTIKLNVGSTRKILINEDITGHSVNEEIWTNIGLTLTQEGSVSEEDYVEINNNSMIVTFQFNQL